MELYSFGPFLKFKVNVTEIRLAFFNLFEMAFSPPRTFKTASVSAHGGKEIFHSFLHFFRKTFSKYSHTISVFLTRLGWITCRDCFTAAQSFMKYCFGEFKAAYHLHVGTSLEL